MCKNTYSNNTTDVYGKKEKCNHCMGRKTVEGRFDILSGWNLVEYEVKLLADGQQYTALVCEPCLKFNYGDVPSENVSKL